MAIDDPYSGLLQLMTNLYGFSPDIIQTLIAVSIALILALFVIIKFDNKEIGLPVFFGTLIIMVFLGAISWLLVVIPLILTALFYYYSGGKG